MDCVQFLEPQYASAWKDGCNPKKDKTDVKEICECCTCKAQIEIAMIYILELKHNYLKWAIIKATKAKRLNKLFIKASFYEPVLRKKDKFPKK